MTPHSKRVPALTAILLAAGLLAACGSGSSSSGSGSTTATTGGSTSNSYAGKTIPIGAVFSLTGLGSVYGPQQKQAAQLAVDTLNGAGGVNGGMLKLDAVDDGSDKSQASQQTQQLIQSNQDLAILGPTLSNSAVGAHPIAAHLKTPMLAVSTTGINIVGPGCTYCADGWIFRDSLGEASAIPANIKAYADAKHPKTGVLLYPNDDKFSADGAQIVQNTVASAGISLLGDPIQFTKAETDLTPYVGQAVSRHPDVIFITSLGGIPAKIMIEARKEGFTGQFLGGNGFNTAAVSKQAADAGKGAQSGSAWFSGNSFPANASFIAAYRAKFGGDPDQFAAQAYTGVLILADAAKRANLTLTDVAGDRAKLRAAMESTSIDTPLGPFKFTTDHDVNQTIWVIAMDGSGGFTLVTSASPR